MLCWTCFQARRILEAELSEERTARTAAEEAKAKAESERTRLQLVQDDLAAQVGSILIQGLGFQGITQCCI